MNRILLLVTAAAIALPMAGAASAAGVGATMLRSDGSAAGQAQFTAKPDGVWLDLTVSGLAPGLHGLHLHAIGACTTPDFASAGAHWNPMSHKHGLQSPDGAHLGDLPNLDVAPDGTGHIATLVAGATLDGGMHGLLDADGTALVVHASPDDNMTDPTGNSGGRQLCGVVIAARPSPADSGR